MSPIHIIPSEFNKELELKLAYSIKAGFPSPVGDYQHTSIGKKSPQKATFSELSGVVRW